MAQKTDESSRLEMWAGLECTINRVKETWHDQCARNGHDRRPRDLELFASLGIQRIRYPLLWERAHAASENGVYGFAAPIARFSKLRELGMRPIAGLLHHGSGPPTTSLVDPKFPEKLAAYARAAAEALPWIDAYTPVNEPLTTARFSGAYGVWYPHGTDDRTMLRCLLNERHGTVLAMREIRRVNPEALLVQTDDVGCASGTEPCRSRIEFENERRWLGFDLLFGRVTEGHALRDWALANGATNSELNWFCENPCPPDVVGLNHYPLSNRYLDHRRELYPAGYYARNDGMAYADLGAPQAQALYPCDDERRGAAPIEVMKEICTRYGAPVAVTEAHIAGTREEQMRWLARMWRSAQDARSEGYPIKAVTAWSLLGSFDWNCLVAECRLFYEPGVFDVRSEPPRPTGLAGMTRSLAISGSFVHPVVDGPSARPIAIVGCGTLGRALGRAAHARGLVYRMLSRQDMDAADAPSVRATLEHLQPWAVINAAGYVRVDAAEREPELARRENALAAETIARECARLDLRLVSFSSDLVFDGEHRSRGEAYVESDTVSPLSVYGRTKVEMEARVLDACPGSLIARTSSFFGPWDSANFVAQTLEKLRAGQCALASDDLVSSPTYVPDLACACLDLLIDGASGLLHLTNVGEMSWLELGREAARRFGFDPALVEGRPSVELGYLAKRPHYSALRSERFQIMPTIQEALDRCRLDFAREVGAV